MTERERGDKKRREEARIRGGRRREKRGERRRGERRDKKERRRGDSPPARSPDILIGLRWNLLLDATE
jgi:hypothetical protein